MKTKAVRLYGSNNIKMEEFELPKLEEDEILARVVSDSVCMSTYKAVIKGSSHKRVPKDIDVNPVIIGHEFAGEIVEVGKKWREIYTEGSKFSIQPNINHKGIGYAPGYSFPYFGGDATYIIIPGEVMEKRCLLDYKGDAYFKASLSEPMSCIVSAFHEFYHKDSFKHEHRMGIVEGGNMAILAGAGPMGMGAIDYAIHNSRRPGLLVVTDIDENRLKRARTVLNESEAERYGVTLKYINTNEIEDVSGYLEELSGGKGYDDVFAFAPVKQVVEMGDGILGSDGCLNFFAGPTDFKFKAEVNFYNVHYSPTHIIGSSGGNTDDMVESLDLIGKDLINPAVMVTHVGGLDSAASTTLNLPNIPGGKKLIYTNIEMELTAIEDFEEKGRTDPLFAKLAEITKNNKGLWSAEAERYLLKNK